MKHLPKVLTIAGSDSGGGAGIQADIKTISALRCYAATAITAITAQNTRGVQAVEPLSPAIIERQIRAVFDDIRPDAVKIGMLASPEIVRLVALLLREYAPAYIVLDPVMVATSGDNLALADTKEVMLELLFPQATLVTPNVPEASALTGVDIRDEHDFYRAWKVLKSRRTPAALIKAGHLKGDALTDMLFTPREAYAFPHLRVATGNTHGTGCTLSSAIAAQLACGDDLPSAVEKGLDYLHGAIGAAVGQRIGGGHGPVDHFYGIR